MHGRTERDSTSFPPQQQLLRASGWPSCTSHSSSRTSAQPAGLTGSLVSTAGTGRVFPGWITGAKHNIRYTQTAVITSPDFLFPYFSPHHFSPLNILVHSHANSPSLFTLSSLALDWLPLYAENGKLFRCGKWQIW